MYNLPVISDVFNVDAPVSVPVNLIVVTDFFKPLPILFVLNNTLRCMWRGVST